MIKTLIFSFLTAHHNIQYWISDDDYLGSFPVLTLLIKIYIIYKITHKSWLGCSMVKVNNIFNIEYQYTEKTAC